MKGLVDCNNFYVSCQRVFRPDLVKRPVVVLSNNDGCIIARSQEVKELGIPMGMPVFKAKPLINQHGIEVFSANFSLYGDMSERVMSVVKDECPIIEVYSIDESFLDLSMIPEDELGRFCQALRAKVFKWTGIPVSIGVAPSKTLAKLANNVAKKHPRANGCWKMIGQEDMRMKSMSVDEVWGVGRRVSKQLNDVGIQTVYDLKQSNTAMIRKRFNVNLERTVRELRGEACIPLSGDASVRQRIMVSRSFGEETEDYQELQGAIANFTSIAGCKLRRQKSNTAMVNVFVETHVHKNKENRYRKAINITLTRPTSDPKKLAAAARNGLEAIYRSDQKYKRAGVIFEDITQEKHEQYCLYDFDKDSDKKLGLVMDQVNAKIGKGMINFASAGLENKWKMKQHHKSPNYTTSWTELLIVG